jgi:hypothetical protein
MRGRRRAASGSCCDAIAVNHTNTIAPKHIWSSPRGRPPRGSGSSTGTAAPRPPTARRVQACERPSRGGDIRVRSQAGAGADLDQVPAVDEQRPSGVNVGWRLHCRKTVVSGTGRCAAPIGAYRQRRHARDNAEPDASFRATGVRGGTLATPRIRTPSSAIARLSLSAKSDSLMAPARDAPRSGRPKREHAANAPGRYRSRRRGESAPVDRHGPECPF